MAAGTTNFTFTISPKNDGLPEGMEAVIITLMTNATYNIGIPHEAKVTIVDPP